MTSEREQVDQDRGHAEVKRTVADHRSSIMTFAEFVRSELERGPTSSESFNVTCGSQNQRGPRGF